jgi:TonB-linked SusC/RagA family outer membrane protein
MRITVFLFFFGIMISNAATSHSQETKLSLNLKSTTIKEACKEIEKQTGLVFVFADNTEAALVKTVDIRANSRSISAILDNMLSNTGLNYKILDKQVVIYREEKRIEALEIREIILEEIVQQLKKTVTGKITDKNGEPLIGANIVEKGTTNGTVTDIDGVFSLQVAEGAELHISYIGFLPQDINTAGRTSFNIILQEDMQSLEDLVVIGYGTRTRRDLTGAVSQITSEEITKTVSISPEFAMQGKMAGVFVSNTGSSPTARPEIRIRGVSTLGSNDPLYVIDGIPLTEGGSGARSTEGRFQTLRGPVNVFTMINPNDIESISVLKDASATAIYGVRASNGVILITTKRGSEGKPKVSLSTTYGVQNIFKRYDVASIDEYVAWSLEAMEANPSFNTSTYQHYPLFDKTSPHYMGNNPNHTKDWLKEGIISNAPIQDYNLNVSGGTQSSTYSLGTGYTSQDDVMYKDSYERLSFFVNSDHKIGKWLKLSESYRLINSQNHDRNTPDFETLSFVPPWQPLFDSSQTDGLARPGQTRDGKFYPYGYGAATKNNFLGIDQTEKTEREFIRNLGTFYAELTPIEGLRIRGTVSLDYYTNKTEYYDEPESAYYSATTGVITADAKAKGNTYTLRKSENINIVKEFLVGYTKTFDNHSIDIIANAMSQDIKWNVHSSDISNNSPITSWDQRYINEGWASSDKGTFYERYSSGLIGYMGRLSYNYAQKYYFDATVRRDGSSKFAPGYKWGTFPSFGGAWRLSSEQFMQDIPWLNDLKIRGGWGRTGNQETRDYAYLSLLNFNPKAAFGDGGEKDGDGTIYPAAVLGDFPIVDMSWETVTTTSAGIDMIALNNKLAFTAEYYNRLTDGILQQISIPKVIGALTSPVVNLAKVSNRGFEFQASYNDRFGDIGFNASANLTTVRNRVSNMYRGQPSNRGDLRIENGYSMNYIYGFKTDGIFQTDKEVEEWKAKVSDTGKDSQKAPGDIRFVDLYGAQTDDSPEGALKDYNPDGKIDDYDKTYLGKTIPGYYYGISLGADYKNWDLYLGFRGVGDVQKINSKGLRSIGGGEDNFLSAYKDRWTSTKPSTSIPRAIQNDPSGNNRIQDRFVQNADFFRFQNFQIGYRFASDLLSRIRIEQLRCYLSGNNLFVISPYNDLDPENITTPTTFTFGVNISF